MPDAPAPGGSQRPAFEDLILVNTAAARCGLSAGHIRRLIRDGEVWGVKLDIYWYTTEQTVREYLARDIKPGPRPK